MFKNGIALVRAVIPNAPAGELIWSEPPTAVHGSFFLEGPPGMTIRSTVREIAAAKDIPTGNLQTDLAGARVIVTLADHIGAAGQTFTGTVWSPPIPDKKSALNPADNGGSGIWTSAARRWNESAIAGRVPGQVAGPFLILEEDGQRQYLAAHTIASVKTLTPPVKENLVSRPVFILGLPSAGDVRISYLTKGMAWVPSYQVELLGDNKLRLRQSAVVKNELMDLRDSELRLISGYPSIRFSHVDAPLTPGVSLASFFAQANEQPGAAAGPMSQSIMYNSVRPGGAQPMLPPPDAGQGTTDIHYHSIGRHSLNAGDAFSMEVAAGETPAERVVEWTVPDTRDSWGRPQRPDQYAQPQEDRDPWDAVQFINPFKIPLTSAAASVMEDGQFRGQSMTNWTAPGQQACLRITKALTISAQAGEREEEEARENVAIGGREYRRTGIAGEYILRNDRTVPAKIVVRLEYSGEFLEAEENPVKSLRAAGAWNINQQRKLEWTLTLAAGEEKKVRYRYRVLVLN